MGEATSPAFQLAVVLELVGGSSLHNPKGCEVVMALEGRHCSSCGQPVVEKSDGGWIHVVGIDDDLPKGWSDHDAVPVEEDAPAPEVKVEEKPPLTRQADALERIATALERIASK